MVVIVNSDMKYKSGSMIPKQHAGQYKNMLLIRVFLFFFQKISDDGNSRSETVEKDPSSKYTATVH